MAEMDGKPEVRQWADARDLADGCVRALQTPAAAGETFNLGGAAPFTSEEQVCHMAERLGLPYVTACLPISRKPWYISSAKARGLLGYARSGPSSVWSTTPLPGKHSPLLALPDRRQALAKARFSYTAFVL